MAADLSEFEAIAERHPKVCTVARALARLDKKDRAAADAALLAEHIGDNTIARWFGLRNVRIGNQSVGRHRKGECCCRD